tara:strand:- start:273 stop:626 length:354 start_codon:yes stop_codon:yes gene_type:complete
MSKQYDHEAIRKAYPNVVVIEDYDGVYEQTGTDENDTAILSKITIDQSKVDAARNELNSEFNITEYARQRTGEAGTTDTIYAPWADQLDMMYKDAINGTTTWKDHITAVKNKYPKPS